MDEFYQYYNDVIKHSLKKLENDRIEQYKKYTLFSLSQTLSAAAIVIAFLAFLIGTANFRGFILLLVIFVGLFLFLRKKKAALISLYKMQIRIPIMKKILAMQTKNATPSRISAFDENGIRILCGADRKEDINFYNKRGVTVTYNDAQVEFFPAEKVSPIDRKKMSEEDEEDEYDISTPERFFGKLIGKIDESIENTKADYFLAVSFSLPKSAEGKIFILPKNTPYSIGQYYNHIVKVKMKNEQINESYDIYTDNTAAIKAAEVSDFFSSVLDSKENYYGELGIIIDNNVCLAVIKTTYDIFKFQINEELDNGGKFNDISQYLEFLLKLINKVKKSLP